MSTRIEPAEERAAARARGGREVAKSATKAAVVVTHWERAPFSLHCGAVLIDYALLVGIIAVATIFSRALGSDDRTRGDTALIFGYLVTALVAAFDLFVLPGLTGQTLGKWATGVRIVRHVDGRPVGFAKVFLRHTLGYLLTALTLGVGFLISIFSAQGRALHDLVAGTSVVVPARQKP
ncbi:MAG: RDD family protein [Pyrinomonadaceae bacterium]